jgi:hypothetical protein
MPRGADGRNGDGRTSDRFAAENPPQLMSFMNFYFGAQFRHTAGEPFE